MDDVRRIISHDQENSDLHLHDDLSADTGFDIADLLILYLDHLGVEFIFGVPGGAIEPIYNALARHQRKGGRIRHVVARHEAGAAFMADGYARETGKMGVCVATSGPGATNLLTAIATSFTNNVPVLAITGQLALPTFGRHGLQDSSCTGIDVTAMFRHCTRFNSLVSHKEQFETKFINAIQSMFRSDRGPAHLSIPVDVLRASSPLSARKYDLRTLTTPPALISIACVDKVTRLLAAAHNPVLLIGGGSKDAIDKIVKFVVRKGIQYVTTPDAKGLLSPHHASFKGVFGFAGHSSANALLSDSSVDLIIAVGTSMGEWNTCGWSDHLLNSKLVHIDSSEDHLSRTPMAKYHLRGDIGMIFELLDDQISSPEFISPQSTELPYKLDDLLAFSNRESPIKPQRLMAELGSMFPEETPFYVDAGNSVAWAIHYLHPRLRPDEIEFMRKRNWLQLTAHFAPMGWAIGAAIGAALAKPGHPTVCITGDGSLLMNGQEFSVAVAERLPAIFVILNDQALGMVKHGQRLGGGEQIAFELPPTDFAMLARSLGGQSFTIKSADDLSQLNMAEICNRQGPTLLDVYIDPDEVPPMGSRLNVLLSGK